MTSTTSETLEILALKEELEAALVRHWSATVDGRPGADYELGVADGLARAIGELEATDPLEVHVRAVAAIVERSEEGRELVARAREALVAGLRRT